MAMKKSTIWLTDDLRARLKALVAEKQVPMAELIRRALDEYLKRAKGK